jgi:hypothetical protein
MRKLQTPIQRAESVAAGQEGAIGCFQATAAGMSQDQIDHQVRTGRWRRPIRGVYCSAGSPDTRRQRAVVAFLAVKRAGGVISHVSAAVEWGLAQPVELPHVTVPPNASHGCRGAKVHRATIPSIDRAYRGVLVVTSVSRTIVDLASIVDRCTLERIVDEAICRKLATVASVLAAASRIGRGRRGLTMLRSVLEAWSPEIRPGSPAEVRLLRQASEFGLLGLVSQHEVFDEGGDFVGRLDLAFPERCRALEYEGVEPHNPRTWDRDESRYARLRSLGWEVETIGKLDLCPGEPRLREIARRWTA